MSLSLNTRAALASVATALFLLGLKAYATWVTGSVAMLGSLADTGLDLIASLVTFIAVRIAATPADAEHRFGHGKAEALAARLASYSPGGAVVREDLQHSDPVLRELAGPNQRGADIVDWQGPGLGELLSTVFQRDAAWLSLADPSPVIEAAELVRRRQLRGSGCTPPRSALDWHRVHAQRR